MNKQIKIYDTIIEPHENGQHKVVAQDRSTPITLYYGSYEECLSFQDRYANKPPITETKMGVNSRVSQSETTTKSPQKQKYVAGFLFSENKTSVALIEKIKPEWQNGKLNAIGGKIEASENPHNAMNREFREETGLDIDEWTLFCAMEGDDFEVHFFVSFSDVVFKAQSIEEETVHVVDVDALQTLCVIPNLLWLIPMALDTNSFIANVKYL